MGCGERMVAVNSDFVVAVHALVYLSHRRCLTSSEHLANNICTHAARVRKVMVPLKGAGFVTTHEGKVGGYQIYAEPASIRLSMVAAALGVTFVQSNWKSGSHDVSCLIASGMADTMDTIFDDLNRYCYERLAQITIADIEARVCSKVSLCPPPSKPQSMRS